MADEGANIIPIIALSIAIGVFLITAIVLTIVSIRTTSGIGSCENSQSIFIHGAKCEGIGPDIQPDGSSKGRLPQSFYYYPVRYSKKLDKTIRFS